MAAYRDIALQRRNNESHRLFLKKDPGAAEKQLHDPFEKQTQFYVKST